MFDFDPARTLTIFEEFANNLNPGTAGGKGTLDEHKQNIRRLLNFLPVLGEDEDGEMVELDAERVLSLPRKIRSREVVRRGFMSDYLFQNISNVFRAPQEIVDILQSLTPTSKPAQDMGEMKAIADEADLNDKRRGFENPPMIRSSARPRISSAAKYTARLKMPSSSVSSSCREIDQKLTKRMRLLTH